VFFLPNVSNDKKSMIEDDDFVKDCIKSFKEGMRCDKVDEDDDFEMEEMDDDFELDEIRERREFFLPLMWLKCEKGDNVVSVKNEEEKEKKRGKSGKRGKRK